MTSRSLFIVSLTVLSACGSLSSQADESRPAGVQVGPAPHVVERAELALSGKAGPDEWRPALRAELERFLEQMGALPSGGAESPVGSLLNDLDTLPTVARAEPAESAEGLVLVGPLMAATRANRVLVVCREAEFDTLDSSVVVCLGDLRVRSARNSVLFVLGRAEVDEIDRATVCSSGPLDARVTRDTTVVMLGDPARPMF